MIYNTDNRGGGKFLNLPEQIIEIFIICRSHWLSIRVVRKQNYGQFPNNQTFSAIIFLRNTLILCIPRPQATQRGFSEKKENEEGKVKEQRAKMKTEKWKVKGEKWEVREFKEFREFREFREIRANRNNRSNRSDRSDRSDRKGEWLGNLGNLGSLKNLRRVRSLMIVPNLPKFSTLLKLPKKNKRE